MQKLVKNLISKNRNSRGIGILRRNKTKVQVSNQQQTKPQFAQGTCNVYPLLKDTHYTVPVHNSFPTRHNQTKIKRTRGRKNKIKRNVNKISVFLAETQPPIVFPKLFQKSNIQEFRKILKRYKTNVQEFNSSIYPLRIVHNQTKIKRAKEQNKTKRYQNFCI